jgi:hypothetical protein
MYPPTLYLLYKMVEAGQIGRDDMLIGGETDPVAPCMRSFNPGEI